MMNFSNLNRKKMVAKLQKKEFDLLIIGGGITGAGIALDAVSRGMRVALLEKNDFASGTNSKSTKLIHGGLRYLKQFDWSKPVVGEITPAVPAKSGIMLGLGETEEEVRRTIADVYRTGCRMLTIGQYLQPTRDHLAVRRFVTPGEFEQLAADAEKMGFSNVASGPMVRSSYHADQQANPLLGKD